MTHLTVPIMVGDVESALADAARAAEFGADLVEYRIDRYTEDAVMVAALVEWSPLPCILTCRPTWEGGEYDGADADRIALFERVGTGPRPPAYLDVELAAYQRSANLRQKVDLVVDHPEQKRDVPTGLILSSHDFDGRPKDLLRRIEAMAEAPACRVIKVAWTAQSLRDNLEAFEIIERKLKPTIALCMGEYSLASRVLAKKFGALLTFASIENDRGTAPGQPTVAEMKDLYRWDAIDRETRVYGVIGWPIGHSMSPPIHNAGFAAAGVNAVYLPLPIPPEYEHFKATVGSWLDHDTLHFRGASVTIPHKANLLRFVREHGGEVEKLAETIGAANTLVKKGDGSLFACNTDYAAALDSVCDALGITREQLAGKRVAVIGAGGAARAVVAGFAHCGATVVIYNRTPGKAEALAEQFNGHSGKVVAAKLDKLCDSCCEVYINCTPLGMHPNVDDTPMSIEHIAHRTSHIEHPVVVFDTIYNPLETRLLREAKQAGCITIPGTEMFVRQGAAQFELWAGRPAPLDVFHDVLKRGLC